MEVTNSRQPSEPWSSAGGVTVVFQDLTVTAPARRGKPPRELIKRATGALRPGQLAALIGPSGAGKTSLMDALAGRTPPARVSGSVLYDGRAPTRAVLQRLLGYVEQQDALVANLTVAEMLGYTCELRSPPGTPAPAVRQRVDAVVDDLGLRPCRDTLIGGGLRRGVSGGQRRRISLGCALVSAPAVLLLDEPTSGLDSAAAMEVVGALVEQARRGAAILVSIHQPSVRLFAQFNTLFMGADGHLLYAGPNGTWGRAGRQCAQALALLQEGCPRAAASLDAGLPTPDWLLDCLDVAQHTGEVAGLAARRAAGDAGAGEAPPRDLAMLSRQLSSVASAPLQQATAAATHRMSALGAWWVLVKYRTRADLRTRAFLAPRVSDKLALAVLLGTLFLSEGRSRGPQSLQNIVNLTFMWILLPGFAAIGFIPALTEETDLFLRERHAGLYPIISYLLAKMAGELVVILPMSAVLSVAVYYLVGLGGSYALFWLPYLVSMAIGVLVAYLCAAVAPSTAICIILLACYVISLLFFAGLVITWHEIPPWWQWYGYIAYMRYAWGAVMSNQFGGGGGANDAARMWDGQPVLQFYSVDGLSAWAWLGLQFAFWFAYLALAWAALWAREALPGASLPALALPAAWWRNPGKQQRSGTPPAGSTPASSPGSSKSPADEQGGSGVAAV